MRGTGSWPSTRRERCSGCRPPSRPCGPGGGGSIVNVASIFGVTGSEGYIAYTASKAAIIAMTKTAALEHAGDRIRVNAICPAASRPR